MKYAFIFPGQGSQNIGMGRDFYENCNSSKELLQTSGEFCNIDFYDLLFNQNDKINISEFTQPAIVLNSFMAYLALSEKISIKPIVSLGHSLGEFSALGVSNAIEYKKAIKLVNIRGKLMQDACNGKNASMMVILGLSDEKVEKICEQARKIGKLVWAANYNCDGQIVIAGNREDLISLEEEFKKIGAKRAMLLNMSVASHCPMLNEASEELVKYLKEDLKDNFNDVISNATATKYNTKSEALNLLKEQLIKPVLYKQSIKAIEKEVDCFVEFGSSILKGLNKKITAIPTYSITDSKSLEEFINFARSN